MPLSIRLTASSMTARLLTGLLASALFLGILADAQAAPNFKVTGVKDAAVMNNIRLHLQNVNVDTSVTPDRLWKQPVQDAVQSAIKPFGYYEAEMTVIDDDSAVSVNIFLGEPLIITNLTLEVVGEGRTDEWFSKRFKAFPLRKGDRLLQQKYDTFKSEMIATAISRGYFDFTWQAARLDIVREQHEANVLLVARSGPRYKFGNIIVKGDELATDIVNRVNTLTYGDYYRADAVSEFNRILSQTGYFSRAIARPVVKEAQDNIVPIEVTLTQKPRDLFDVGVGFSSDIGPRLDFKWQRPWVNSEGHSIITEAFISAPEQTLTSSYKVPMADVNDDYAIYQVGYEKVDDNDTRSQKFSVSAQRYLRPKGSEWQHSVFIRYLNETFAQASEAKQTTQLVLPGYSISGLRSSGGLDPESGRRIIVTLEGGSQSLASDIDIVRVVAKAKWIESLGDHRFIFRTDLGAIDTNDFSRVPSSLRFFAGGDQSIRGFGYETISPLDENDELTGAQYLTVASAEYAFPIAENWRLATFVDAGTATNDFDEGISWGTGIGAHYLSFIGPVRFYLAYGQNDFETNVRLHVSLGPAL
ncbi:autotransporter assembly complex protein TamA [Alteromonas oceanisediminis]|uniref:autotransporter assembly complex protein TamA n=1 Tax=Alteromonas oceanisediminis TaxID=2836180 RepID=UPI001BD9A2E2|nr:autotransporter assembly complex family protein [Alteromonas oceanisediminis]MBT0586215.1 autotransporter assembly complex protein TamA [Alteromonas oceanisediminis]